MSLDPGTRLGPYEILDKLGEGGMGDVYKGRDTRLERSVAIKIVRTDFSERFEREARSISALNHPNICTLHDVGRLRIEGASGAGDASAEVAYLVMEFIDGAPISGPLPIADVLKYGAQICDALEAAHRKSIIHRDLKPGNILATKSGIKLLDFGLAKLQLDTAAGAPGNDATVAALTGAHTIVGTPQYMAPEQIEGHEADARTDIFSLGCVLYELITGKRAFEGKTASNAMAAVLATEPRKLTELVPVTPPTLEWVVTRCLEKDPDARWQSARDVALQLKWIADHPVETAPGAGRNTPPRLALLTGLAAGIAITGIAAAAWIWFSPRPPGQTSVAASAPVSLSVQMPPGVSIQTSGTQRDITLSPDGRTIAFTGLTADGPAIFLRPLDRFDAVQIAGTEGGEGPFFSTDGLWIGFAAGGQIKKVPVTGGVPVVICDAPALRGIAGLADDTIVFSPTPTGALMRVSARGGTPTPLTTLDPAQQEKTHRTPIVLPGGKVIVFVVGSNEIGTYDDARIVALTLETGKVTELVKGGYSPVFSPTGHLLYVHEAAVFAVPFDPVTLAILGAQVQVLKDVATLPSFGTAEYDVSANGVMAYVPGGNRTPKNEIGWVDRRGNVQPIPLTPGEYFSVEVSPDGRRLAILQGGANNFLLAYDIERSQPTRLTIRLDVEDAIWTHDGSQVTYWSGTDLRSIAADGSGVEETVIPKSEIGSGSVHPGAWSEDGQTLSVTTYTPGKGFDVAVYSRRDKRLTPIAATRFAETSGEVSPDGRWLAYESDESGHREVYLRAVDGSGGKYPVSSGGGELPLWTQHGRELLHASPKGVISVPFISGPPVQLGKPTVLFGNKGFESVSYASVASDGQRFAAIFRKPLTPLTEIRVVTNWR